MKNWKVWAAFLSVFLCGALVGVIITGHVAKRQFVPPKDHAEIRQIIRARALDSIRDEVAPSPEAMAEIETIVDQTLTELTAIRREVFPRIQRVFNRGKERIKEHLTPEQQARLEAMVEERQKGRFGFFRLPPPPPPVE